MIESFALRNLLAIGRVVTFLKIYDPMANWLLFSIGFKVIQLCVPVSVLLPLANVVVRLDLSASGQARDYSHRVIDQRNSLIVVKVLLACA